MSHTDKTAYAELPQWVADDKPTWLGDLNQAFAAIDAKLAEANNNFNSLSSSVAAANQAAAEAQSTANAASRAATSASNDAAEAKAAATGAAADATTALFTARSGGWATVKRVALSNLNFSDSSAVTIESASPYAEFLSTIDGSSAMLYINLNISASKTSNSLRLEIPIPDGIAVPASEVVVRDGAFIYYYTSSGEISSNTVPLSWRTATDTIAPKKVTMTFNLANGETANIRGLGSLAKLV